MTAPPPPDRLRRFAAYETRGGRELGPRHRAVRAGGTLFPSRVFHASVLLRVLKSGHNSRKIGKVVTKGRWRGMPIFTLTLEERRTCPSSCGEWRRCYGNNMHYAQRIVADEAFEDRLWQELQALQAHHPRGFVVRPHILGDFYSVEYVELWGRALDALPALRMFGFTARWPDEPIGAAVAAIAARHAGRFAMRISGSHAPTGGAVTIAAGAETPHIVCPAQLGLTACCATCALCWHSDRTIAFRRH